MLLTSHERALLANFILMCAEDRQRVLAATGANPHASGPLLHAYREVLKLI